VESVVVGRPVGVEGFDEGVGFDTVAVEGQVGDEFETDGGLLSMSTSLAALSWFWAVLLSAGWGEAGGSPARPWGIPSSSLAVRVSSATSACSACVRLRRL
jgi:hypothetical protein